MALVGYEDFDTTSWPDAGPLKNSFVGTAAEFGALPVRLYENFESGWIPRAAFTDDPVVEDFDDHGEFYEDVWDLADATPETPGLMWSPAEFTFGPSTHEWFGSW